MPNNQTTTNGNKLHEIFETYNENNFIFVKPGGNYGDELIYMGAEKVARINHLNFESMNYETFMNHNPLAEDIIYLHGAGGYNPWCSNNAVRIMEHALNSDANTIIQGPCTIESDDNYIKEKLSPIFKKHSKKIYFLCREQVTMDLFIKNLTHKNTEVSLNIDTALYLTKADIVCYTGEVKSRYTLIASRIDNEQSNANISTEKNGIVIDPARFASNFKHWLRIHMAAKEILTNRTHSGILGSILKKNTTLYPSRYHKNKSIWEYSLKNLGVKWSDGTSNKNKKLIEQDWFYSLPHFLIKSHKAQRIARWAQRVPVS